MNLFEVAQFVPGQPVYQQGSLPAYSMLGLIWADSNLHDDTLLSLVCVGRLSRLSMHRIIILLFCRVSMVHRLGKSVSFLWMI